MSTESRISILDPRLSKTGGKVVATAVEHSLTQGGSLATIETLFSALLTHNKVAPVARMIGIEPDFYVTRGTHPRITEATLLWDGEVQTAINHAKNIAAARGAKKAGIVDLLTAVSQHEDIQALFFASPETLFDLRRLPHVLSNKERNFRKLAS